MLHNQMVRKDAGIEPMTIKDAVRICRETGLEGWSLVAFAQRLVNRRMSYSFFNSFDTPKKAFERGMGYCWQQAGALNIILKELGFKSRLVHAMRNDFPDIVCEGVTIHFGVSGHAWCRVRIGSEEKDVCPGSPDNVPGRTHFTPLSRVGNYRGLILLLGYLGSAAVNRKRGKWFLAEKSRLEALRNSDIR